MKIQKIFVYLLILTCLMTAGCVKKSDHELTLSELSQAKSEGQKLSSQLVEANKKIETQEIEVKKLNEQLVEANRKLAIKPKLPVATSVRKATMGEGYVLMVDTTVKRNLKVILTHNVKELQTKAQYNITLNSQLINEFGWQQGITFNSGDTAELSHPDFETLKVAIP